MSDIRQAQRELTRRILEGAGKASPSERRAAFNNTGLAEPLGTLVDKIAKHTCLRAATAEHVQWPKLHRSKSLFCYEQVMSGVIPK